MWAIVSVRILRNSLPLCFGSGAQRQHICLSSHWGEEVAEPFLALPTLRTQLQGFWFH